MRSPRSFKGAAALLLLLASSGAGAGQDVELVPVTTVWGALAARRPVEGVLNPGNRALQVPSRSALLELRPDWKAHTPSLELTARPRLILSHDRATVAGASSSSTDLRLRWSEAFLGWNATDSLYAAYGLQNFQWGPAESASPSNRIFRETAQMRDTLYLVKGKHLLRLSYTPSPVFSEVLLVELSDNGDPEHEAYEGHARKAALKSELSWAGGSGFAGLVAGWREGAGMWLGEYLHVETIEGLFLYADASHQKGSLAHYPVQDPASGLTGLSQARRHSERIFHFAVAGARYSFENGNDLRVEGIYQQAGYDEGELRSLRAAAASPNPLQRLALAAKAEAVFRPGLDLPGQRYLHGSARFPDAFDVRDWSIYSRALYSLQDRSLSSFLSSENAVGDHGTVLSSLGAAFGPADGELKGAVDFSITMAYRHAW